LLLQQCKIARNNNNIEIAFSVCSWLGFLSDEHEQEREQWQRAVPPLDALEMIDVLPPDRLGDGLLLLLLLLFEFG
jgi:hypothetical protein